MTPLEISLKILPALIAILSLLLVIYVGKTYHPMAALHRTYIRIDGILHEKKVFFDYEETRRFLMSHGAADHFGPWIDPVKYLAIRICLAAIGFTVGIYVNAFVGLVGMVIGFFLLPLLLLYINNKDNDALTPQIQTLYSLLQVQIHAGVPMIDALSESYQSFPAGRLRNALSEFSTTIILTAHLINRWKNLTENLTMDLSILSALFCYKPGNLDRRWNYYGISPSRSRICRQVCNLKRKKNSTE